MTKSATINTATAKKLAAQLEQFEELKTHILRLLPDGIIPYGSKLWWEKETLIGDESITNGEFKSYKNPKALIADLHKGK